MDDLVRTDAATLAEGMLAAVEGDGQEETDLENACNPNQKRSSDGRFASGTGASIHARKGGRSSNGNPKGSPNKTNTPRKLPPNATQGDKERELAKAISEKRTRGGQPRTVAGVTVTVSGTHHQQDGHKQDPNATPENMAKALTRDPHKDEDGVIGRYKNLKTVADPNGKGSRISVTALTQRRQSEHKKKKAPKQDSGAVQDR